MPLNSSGAISLGGSTAGQSVNLELGQSATATVSFQGPKEIGFGMKQNYHGHHYE